MLRPHPGDPVSVARPLNRVVVTGVGIVSALGSGGSGDVAPMVATGRSAIAPVRAFSTDGFGSRLAAELPPAALDGLVDATEARRLSRVSQITVGACRLAMRDAGREDADGMALVLGTEFGDLRSTQEFADGYLRRGIVGLSPLMFPNTVMNTMAAATAIALRLQGPSITVNARHVAGEMALAQAAAAVASGRVPAALAGGVDELHRFRFRMLCQLGVLSPRGGGEEGCRPFDRRANGLVHGEGATVLLLESMAAAAARGARMLGEIRGFAWRSGRRPAAVEAALRMADTSPRQIGWIYGAAGGDPLHDAAEVAAIRRSFRAGPPALTSLAPSLGHHAGLGAFHVAAATWTAPTGRLPGIATLERPCAAAAGVAAGPGVHAVGVGPGLVHGLSGRGDQVALVVAPI
jgi:3-oxoacyl-[acyl-carrier-protein] synthase II